MMQIIIDIPEEEYQNYLKMRPAYPDSVFCYIKAIQNGTPLQKGHGRIADMDEAIKCIKDAEGEDAVWAISLIEWACGKRTIIEADRKIDEGKNYDIFEVKVIPCKECKWHGYLTCSNPNGLKGWVTDNDFCSYVERRETDVI